MAEKRRTGKLAVILHADVADSTDLVRRDEQLAHQRIQDTFRRFGSTITKYQGHVRELRGDALLAEFERASDAVTAALAFQADQLDYLAQLNDSIQPTVRVGIAMGEVIIADDTITGAGVVLAQRLEQLADSGGVVVQGAAYETIPDRFPFGYENLGEHEVKGFDEPVRAYGARLKGGADLPQPTPTVHRTRKAIIAMASVAIASAGITLMWLKPWEVREAPASIERMAFSLPDKPSIAVLPLDNMSDDASQDYFADGMTEDLITDLSKNSGLFVIARNSSFSYKGQHVEIRQVAEELGVRYILEGSVRRAGDQVRINAQLIDATTGGHVWADRYDGQLTDIFALQDQVTMQIVKALQISLTGSEVGTQAQHSTDNVEAHDAFLQGWALYIQERPEFLTQALPFFEKAVFLDENYSQAHAALASIIWDAQQNDRTLDLGIFSFEVEERIEEHLEAALVSPTPLAHDLQARIYLSHSLFDKAVQEAEKAVDLDGNNATAHAALANALVLAGKPEEGAEAIGKAMRLDPHYPPSYLEILGAAQFWSGKYHEAIESVKHAIERNPENDLPRLYLAASYARLGRINEGEAAMEAANYARNLRGLSELVMEKSNEPEFTPFTQMAAIDFQAFGQNQNQDQIREDLLKIPALNWPYLITTYESSTPGGTWWEVEGATQINAATAKNLHARGAKFIDAGFETDWQELHIPGAHYLPLNWVYLNMSGSDGGRNVLNRVALGEIVNKSDELVIYTCSKNNPGGCSEPWGAAKAVSWGYQNVYFIDLSSTIEWMEAGYTLD